MIIFFWSYQYFIKHINCKKTTSYSFLFIKKLFSFCDINNEVYILGTLNIQLIIHGGKKMKNNKVFIQEKEEIKKVLCKFQEGYSKRDTSIINEYVEELICKDQDTYAVGTGEDEWCFGWEEVKELVESDWEYWVDLTLDTINPIIYVNGKQATVVTKGSLKYTFEDSEERYENYLEFLKEHFNGEEDLSKLSSKSKLTNINYILTHLMKDRDQKKREEYWPVTFTGILIKDKGKWKFKYMQFSMPTTTMYPDERYNTTEEYLNSFIELKKKMKEFKKNNQSGISLDIENTLDKLQKSYLSNERNINDILSDFFIEDESMIIDVDGSFKIGLKQIKGVIHNHREKWDNMLLDINESVIMDKGNMAWFTITGMAVKNQNEDQILNNQIEDTKKLFELNLITKEKLFRIQRNISIMLKELSKGEDFVWPFRLEGFMIREDDKWLFQTMQISYPFSMILEGKYNANINDV